MIKVLVLDAIHESGLTLLRARDDIELIYLQAPSEADIARGMRDAEYVILRGRKLADEHYRQASRLRLVSRHGVGCDNMNLPLLEELGIGVAVAADSNYVSVAEHAMMLTLAACKNLVRAEKAVRGNNWSARDNLGARDLDGAETLIVGFGRIGRAFAQRAAAFGARIMFYDPLLPDGASLPDDCQRVWNLSAVQKADVISIHIPNTPNTAGMFNDRLLSQIKPGAILVNTARGGIVDEKALASALDNGLLAVYATDVLASEPPDQDDPLLRREDVIVTPHSAAMTAQSAQRMSLSSAQNILDHLDGSLSRQKIVLAAR